MNELDPGDRPVVFDEEAWEALTPGERCAPSLSLTLIAATSADTSPSITLIAATSVWHIVSLTLIAPTSAGTSPRSS